MYLVLDTTTTTTTTSTNITTAQPLPHLPLATRHCTTATLFLGDLEPWIDEHFLVHICSLLANPRPPAVANATRHPNNFGYTLLIAANPEAALRVCHKPIAPPSPRPILLQNSNQRSPAPSTTPSDTASWSPTLLSMSLTLTSRMSSQSQSQST